MHTVAIDTVTTYRLLLKMLFIGLNRFTIHNILKAAKRTTFSQIMCSCVEHRTHASILCLENHWQCIIYFMFSSSQSFGIMEERTRSRRCLRYKARYLHLRLPGLHMFLCRQPATPSDRDASQRCAQNACISSRPTS